MRYEDLSVPVRPRNPWEAIDLGVAMTRQWWREVYAGWFMLTLPIFILANVLLSASPGWALLLVWWLKPLYDRLLLLFYSQAVFGQHRGPRQLLATLPAALRGSGLLLQLTLYRFDVARALRSSVWQLEGLHGRPRRERYRVLARRAGGHAAWLMFACLHLEAFLQLAVLGLVWLFTPSLILESLWQQAWNLLSDSNWPYGFYLGLNTLHYLAMSAIEPLYVAGGFSLYLNRRTQLEGWDLEIAFRRLSRRLSGGAAASGTTALLWVCALVLATGVPDRPAGAEPATTVVERSALLDADASGEVIEQVLANKDFGGTRPIERWRFKGDLDIDDEETERNNLDLRTLADIFKLLLWGGLLVALGFFILRIIRYRGPWAARRKRGASPPTVVSGLDIRPASLPADVAAEARRLWLLGDYREALSLAYRGALSALVHRYGVDLHHSATEGDVLIAAVGHLDASGQDCLGVLTGLWQRQAYAHRRPDEAAVLGMLARWDAHFAPAVNEPSVSGASGEGGA